MKARSAGALIPSAGPDGFIQEEKRYPTSADTIAFLKAQKQPVRSSVRCYCVTWWLLLARIHIDTS